MDGQSPDAWPVGWREQVLGTDLRSSAVLTLLTTPHLPPWATHQLSVRRIACSGCGTKNVPRPDRTDVVLSGFAQRKLVTQSQTIHNATYLYLYINVLEIYLIHPT